MASATARRLRPVAAIHLAEMVLAAEPTSRPALEAYLAAHEHLIEERGGENFWETGGLRHQLERTKGALAGLRLGSRGS